MIVWLSKHLRLGSEGKKHHLPNRMTGQPTVPAHNVLAQ